MNQRKKKRLKLQHKQLIRKFNDLPFEKRQTVSRLAAILPLIKESSKIDDYALAGG